MGEGERVKRFYETLEHVLKMKLSDFIDEYRELLPRYGVIDEETNISSIIEYFEKGFSYLIIVDKKNRVKGVLSYIDFLHMFGRRKTTALSSPFSSVSRSLRHSKPSLSTFTGLSASDIIHNPPPHLLHRSTVEEALQHMDSSEHNYIIVVNESGEIVGVITLHSIFRAILNRLKKD